jgi:hypothetical protein
MIVQYDYHKFDFFKVASLNIYFYLILLLYLYNSNMLINSAITIYIDI